jgi:hypothetical protein
MRTLLPLLVGLGCAAPIPGSRGADFATDASFLYGSEDEISALAVDVIDSADTSLRIALPAGEDTRVTDAILSAFQAGLDVEVVTDWDRREDAGIAALIDAGIPVTLADDGIAYFEFSINEDIVFSSEDTILSSAFVVADEQRFVIANDLGHLDGRDRHATWGDGQDFANDLVKEHNQLFGGTDAVARTAFSNPAKSIADPRWLYRLHDGRGLELWFGPQERCTKRIIDAVYRARSNVRVLTDDLANEGLILALQDKAKLGFDVEVIVGPSFGTNSSALARLFANDARDVRKRRTDDSNPTIVILDTEPARDGQVYPARVFALSHDLISANRLYRGTPVRNDQLIDGVLWVVEDELHRATPAARSEALAGAIELYEAHLSASGAF